MKTLVLDRDRTCRHPGCNRSAARGEIDHILDWAYGGPTTPTNLQALCGRHHHLKHEAGWEVNRSKDGHTIWTDPAGRQYDKPPDDIPIDTILEPPCNHQAEREDDPPPF